MSGQDTLESAIGRHGGASHALAVVELGKLGFTHTRHGAPDRWDWGVTFDTLFRAQEQWARDDKELAELTPSQRIDLFAHDSAVARRLRRHWGRSERAKTGAYATGWSR